MTEVIAALIAPIPILLVLILLTERVFYMGIQAAKFVEGLNQ